MFAEGRHADDARKAGAHIVGGPELSEGVSQYFHRLDHFDELDIDSQ